MCRYNRAIKRPILTGGREVHFDPSRDPVSLSVNTCRLKEALLSFGVRLAITFRYDELLKPTHQSSVVRQTPKWTPYVHRGKSLPQIDATD